jgi:prepilin-type processing-associated H-X9-DG protein
LVVIAIIGVLLSLAAVGLQRAWQSARRVRCQNNLRQIGFAVAAYANDHGVFPFGVGADSDMPGQPRSFARDARRYAIHSQLLPYLDHGDVYDQLNFLRVPFDAGRMVDPTGFGANDTAARTVIDLFLCPSDRDRLPMIEFSKTNYRSCNGSTWSGRDGNGMFSQVSSVRPGHVLDGLSKTAAFSERIRGDGDSSLVDMLADVYGKPVEWTEETLRAWCSQISEAEAATLNQNSDGGRTWLEGNMNWTRYNHLLPPGAAACKGRLTWDGCSMPPSSKHGDAVNVLFGDGSVRYIENSIDEVIWRAMGSVAEQDEVLAAQ